MKTYDIIAAIHATIGALALITFWTAAIARKGSPVHRKSGKIYLLAIAAVLLTGAPLAISRFFAGQITGGTFLSFLLVLTATSAWTSWRAIRDQKSWRNFVGPVYQLLMWSNLLAGLAVIYVALNIARDPQVIMLVFAGLGLLLFVNMYRFARKEPTDPRWWLGQHLGSMLGNGIATHIAFLSLGLPRLMPQIAGPGLQMMAWFGPVVVSAIAGVYLTRKYLKPRRVAVQKNPNQEGTLHVPRQ